MISLIALTISHAEAIELLVLLLYILITLFHSAISLILLVRKDVLRCGSKKGIEAPAPKMRVFISDKEGAAEVGFGSVLLHLQLHNNFFSLLKHIF